LFHRNMSAPYSRYKMKAMLTFLRIVGKYLQGYTTSHPTRSQTTHFSLLQYINAIPGSSGIYRL
jgi:hypothetical protein